MSRVTAAEIARRPRAYVRVAGPDAADYLNRMVSNEVLSLEVGAAVPALLLTAKARVIAPLLVWRRGAEDFLVLTEPELGEVVRAQLARMRLRARCEVEPEEHSSVVVFGGAEGIPTEEFGEAAVEVLDAALEPTLAEGELELRRIEAGRPAWGKEIDERILPAEAGLTETHVSFTKGCYPGQEPVARLHYRGHANRSLRVLELAAAELPEYDAELSFDERAVGRVTSAARRPDGTIVALAYVRTDVPEDAELALTAGTARPLHWPPPRP
jgi:folate-binding protein YgfZ